MNNKKFFSLYRTVSMKRVVNVYGISNKESKTLSFQWKGLDFVK